VKNHTFCSRFFHHFWLVFINGSVIYSVFKGCVHDGSILIVKLSDNFCVRKDVFSVDSFFDVYFFMFDENEFQYFKDNNNKKQETQEVQNVPVILKGML
jgi:hypothetical protein